MKTSAAIAKEVESSYLAGVSANLKTAGSRFIAGSWFKREDHDDGEKVRATMVDRRIYDRHRYAELPHGRGFTIRGFERRWLFGKRIKSVTVASVLAPPGPLLESEESAPPVSSSQLMEHVRSLMTEGKATHLIGVCSPSGFEEDVWNNPPEFQNVKLVLVAPREDGGWRVSAGDTKLDPRLCKLFDPEDVGHKINRVRREVEARSTDLLTGSLSATKLARDLELPVPLVNNALEAVAKADPELRVSKRSGDVTLYRGAAVMSYEEDGSMSLAEWIKSLFSKQGEEAKKINVLSERRASLSGRLDRLYEDIGKLEKREEKLRQEGKAAGSQVAKRSKAAQISRLRKEIARCNTSAAMLSKQINIISTHIHNLELAQTGNIAQLPSSEDLTEAAVNAEEILEQLNASDDLVSSLDIGMAESAMSDDEAEILRELEGDTPEKASTGKKQESASEAARSSEPEERERPQAQAE
ncbi:MAG: hypothetical protein MI923_09910 [Phycisphaerales bacterium]|nr:hypothetical protein [Phycisphaerales bacterium]